VLPLGRICTGGTPFLYFATVPQGLYFCTGLGRARGFIPECQPSHWSAWVGLDREPEALLMHFMLQVQHWGRSWNPITLRFSPRVLLGLCILVTVSVTAVRVAC
jgi:hypothetical protein